MIPARRPLRVAVGATIAAALTIGTTTELVGTRAERQATHAETGEFNRALGVACDFCHSSGGDDTPPRQTAERMLAMVGALNAALRPVAGHVTCWTCHAGARVPSRLPRAAWQQALREWPTAVRDAAENTRLTMAVYTASVGRRCAGCHEDGGSGSVTAEAAAIVRTMTRLFPVMEKYLPFSARTQCFMCHKGRPHPQMRPTD